jgi:hypothetical protein
VLQPLRAEILAADRQWIFALDGLLGQRSWTNRERATLRDLLCERAGLLLEGNGEDAELKALYDKHAEVDFDTAQREAALAMKDLAEEMTGLDLGGDDGLHTEDDLRQRVREGFSRQEAAAQARREERATRRGKSAAQQRRETEAQQSSQSLREIFRKLASALHPDRELDETQRAAKTDLMQRVNQAYAANDLLAMLELQLQVEQIDASHLAHAGAARLKHYNKVLDEQLAELCVEIARVEIDWRMEFGVNPTLAVQPRTLCAVIDGMQRQWRAELTRMQEGTRVLADVAATRRWLKRQRMRLRDGHFGPPP